MTTLMHLPRWRLNALIVVSWLAAFAWQGIAQETRPLPTNSTSGSPTNLIAGRTIVPPLAPVAATNQDQLRKSLCAQSATARWQAREFTNRSGAQLRYRFFTPTAYDARQQYPLVLSLHGGGGTRSFDDLLQCAAPVFAVGPARFVSSAAQARHPCFVVAPWSGGRSWDAQTLEVVVELVESLRREWCIDTNRLYVTGQSMGGFGTWRLITRRPGLFAAAIPVCGGGEPSTAAAAKDTAIWAFHGSKDRLVPVAETQGMIEALLRAGAHPCYWEYENAGHADTAERAYCEPQLLDWLFAQRKQ